MKFYIVKNVNNASNFKSEGIDIMLMSKSYKILDRSFPGKSLEDLIDFNFVFLDKPYIFLNKDNFEFQHISKNLKFGLIKDNSIFEFKDDKESYFAAIHDGLLKSYTDKTDLEKSLTLSTVKASNLVEAKALNWLENGKVGLSSGTICATLFPSLASHHKLADKFHNGKLEINWPHDNSDFQRCINFFEAVPEAKNKIKQIAELSKEWESLIESWDQIEALINTGYRDESYTLIKSCLNSNKKIKPK